MCYVLIKRIRSFAVSIFLSYSLRKKYQNFATHYIYLCIYFWRVLFPLLREKEGKAFLKNNFFFFSHRLPLVKKKRKNTQRDKQGKQKNKKKTHETVLPTNFWIQWWWWWWNVGDSVLCCDQSLFVKTGTVFFMCISSTFPKGEKNGVIWVLLHTSDKFINSMIYTWWKLLLMKTTLPCYIYSFVFFVVGCVGLRFFFFLD